MPIPISGSGRQYKPDYITPIKNTGNKGKGTVVPIKPPTPKASRPSTSPVDNEGATSKIAGMEDIIDKKIASGNKPQREDWDKGQVEKLAKRLKF